ncbi:TlpA family protein disulfide reductase [Pseudobacteriovorax antillogorgiicola]|uniref:Thiol-disulfide isomerase or thioredoxin n=1 Tax=Pseudobacteriovorax antillogorgiicola TaxID=1513793 RepID=A0A1Y6BU07_9BACT|nr:redoxin domain-containing protein [Pseudobacteriovorax antillogorgiicola]TCS52430.1 thiol-disulfide isomerase/thioredoxin [Pseudobacteriovorax antillogorgiicola]SMF28732.1 Thiol-disulfide isomerase or thioredoxin [Pseudobacteriovorax antillogorgiicola]
MGIFTRAKESLQSKIWWRRLGINILWLLTIIFAAEWFQARNHPSGQLDPIFLKPLARLDGASSPLIESQDPLTLVYAFAPWCGVCRMTAEDLNDLGGVVTVKPLALSWESQESIKQFVTEASLSAPVFLGDDRIHGRNLKIEAFPSYYLVDAKGKVLYSWVGYSTTWGIISKSLLFKNFLID